MNISLYVVYTEQQLFEAVLIHLKHKSQPCLFLAEERVRNSIYLSKIQNQKITFFKESDYPYPNFIGRLRRVAKYDLLPKQVQEIKVSKLFNGSRYCFLSELLCNKFHKAQYYELDDGLDTNFLTDHWLRYNNSQLFFDLFKKVVKYPFLLYVLHVRNYELFEYNFNYLRKSRKIAVRWLPEIESRVKIPVVSLFSLINQKDIFLLYESIQSDNYKIRDYFFLSFDTKEFDITVDEDYVYVGHPRRNYDDPRIIKGVPSDLISIHNSIVTQPSSLVLVFLFAKKYLKSKNVLTVNRGDLLIHRLCQKSDFVRGLVLRGEIITR
jgi:hypothetical protein